MRLGRQAGAQDINHAETQPAVPPEEVDKPSACRPGFHPHGNVHSRGRVAYPAVAIYALPSRGVPLRIGKCRIDRPTHSDIDCVDRVLLSRR